MLLSNPNGNLHLDHDGGSYFVEKENSTARTLFNNSGFVGETFTGTLNQVNYKIKFAKDYTTVKKA